MEGIHMKNTLYVKIALLSMLSATPLLATQKQRDPESLVAGAIIGGAGTGLAWFASKTTKESAQENKDYDTELRDLLYRFYSHHNKMREDRELLQQSKFHNDLSYLTLLSRAKNPLEVRCMNLGFKIREKVVAATISYTNMLDRIENPYTKAVDHALASPTLCATARAVSKIVRMIK
jgi:hypothetical protein